MKIAFTSHQVGVENKKYISKDPQHTIPFHVEIPFNSQLFSYMSECVIHRGINPPVLSVNAKVNQQETSQKTIFSE